MKLLAWLFYGALLAGGVALLWSKQPREPAVFQATIDMRTGHRLSPGDIRLPGGDRFLRHGVAAGATLDERDLIILPPTALARGVTPLTVALAPGADVDRLQQRHLGYLCPGLPKTSMVSIGTLLCAEGDKVCLAVVGIPPALANAPRANAPLLSDTPCPPNPQP